MITAAIAVIRQCRAAWRDGATDSAVRQPGRSPGAV